MDAYLYVNLKYKYEFFAIVMKASSFLMFLSVIHCSLDSTFALKSKIPWRKESKTMNIAVRFTSKSCAICERLASDWEELKTENPPNIKLYTVNCDEDLHVCDHMNVTSYPTIRIRLFNEWTSFQLPYAILNETIYAVPTTCKFPDDESQCHPKTVSWIKDNSIEDLSEFEKLYKAEQEMFNIGVADLTKDFLEKRIVWMQLQEWRDYMNLKDQEL